MKKIFVFMLAIVIVSSLILAGCAAPSAPSQKLGTADVIDFKFSYHMPAPSSPGQAFKKWSDKVEEACNGKIKITHYSAQTLAKQSDQLDAVMSGLADIALLATGAFPGRFPLSELVQLPMLYPNAEVSAKVNADLLEKYAASREYKDLKLLWVFPMPPHGIIKRNPIETMEDWKGQKLRIEGKYENMMVERMGGSGVYMSPMDLYSSIERGVVDGVIFQWDGALVYGIEKVTKYRTEAQFLCRGMPIVMNKAKWESLPPDIQQKFNEIGGVSYSTEAGVAADELNIKRRQELVDYDKQAGNPGIYELPEAEMARWKAEAKIVQDTWAADCDKLGLPGTDMLNDALSLTAKYSQ